MSFAVTGQPPGQPLSKAAPIAQLTIPVVAQSDDEAPAKYVEGLRGKPRKPGKDRNHLYPASLQSTLALIQRILTPDRNAATQTDTPVIEDILPPLTSSNDVDIELYAVLAIVIKDFVNTWYSKITTDHGFVEEVIQIIAHCSRALEQRLRQIDTAALLLDEVPSLVRAHVDAYRTSKSASDNSPYNLSMRHLYHELDPHPALSPPPSHQDLPTVLHQEQSERAYRQLLIQGSLAILLPTEDLQNGPLRTLVGDIIADLIVGQALAGKVCEGWFLHDTITKLSAVVSEKVQPRTSGDELSEDAKSRLEKFGLLASQSKSQQHHSSSNDQSKISAWSWRILQYGYLLYLFLRYVLRELQLVHQKPQRQQIARISTLSPTMSGNVKSWTPTSNHQQPRPVLTFGVHAMISTLLKVADRMPWLASMLLFLQHLLLAGVGQVGQLNSILDRLLYDAIKTHVLPPSLLPTLLRTLRTALFPNNSMGPSAPPPPSIEERLAIKRRAAESVRGLIPTYIARKYYATNDNDTIVKEITKDILDPLDDVYLNKHLVYAVLELILIRLIPELAEQPVSDLLAERGVDWEEAAALDILSNGMDDGDS